VFCVVAVGVKFPSVLNHEQSDKNWEEITKNGEKTKHPIIGSKKLLKNGRKWYFVKVTFV
jgi:hypothetical protein